MDVGISEINTPTSYPFRTNFWISKAARGVCGYACVWPWSTSPESAYLTEISPSSRGECWMSVHVYRSALFLYREAEVDLPDGREGSKNLTIAGKLGSVKRSESGLWAIELWWESKWLGIKDRCIKSLRPTHPSWVRFPVSLRLFFGLACVVGKV